MADEQKTTNLNIRIEKYLKKRIDRAAKKSKLGSSAWIRWKLQDAAKRELGK